MDHTVNADSVSGWERLAGITSAIAVLAWLSTLSMWAAQLFSWVFRGHVPHPSVIGVARSIFRWFGITHTWADSPYAGVSAYTVLKHAYVATSCLIVAALFSVVSVILIVRDDRSRALPALEEALPSHSADR